jgi:hypothetical protein
MRQDTILARGNSQIQAFLMDGRMLVMGGLKPQCGGSARYRVPNRVALFLRRVYLMIETRPSATAPIPDLTIL